MNIESNALNCRIQVLLIQCSESLNEKTIFIVLMAFKRLSDIDENYHKKRNISNYQTIERQCWPKASQPLDLSH
jgi:hypothetical protein